MQFTNLKQQTQQVLKEVQIESFFKIKSLNFDNTYIIL